MAKGLTAEVRARIVKAQKARWTKHQRAEQAYLPGMEPKRIPEVHKAAMAFAEAKDDQKDASTIVKEKTKLLVAQMRKHGIDSYNIDGLVVKAKPDTRVTVKVKDKKKAEDALGKKGKKAKPQ